ncbi:hypothetical protein Acr_06g0007690 [Actinidia rufa]|uniref:BED-type domain-containing protein n=1 Tax=Actinidia rufa TaxID=165716 RepID=A0A7J0ES58_9ERIC|nr:hypothetical protein Acr_06g0007690 [Actinidia rufa]
MDSSGQNSTSTPSTRGKTDPAWEHVTEGRAHDGKKTFTCLYCGKITKGGGINRMKQHLAGKSGEVRPCKKVPADIRFRMEECLKAIREKKRPSEEAYEQSIPYGLGIYQFEGDIGYDDDDDEVEEIIFQKNKGISINEGGDSGNKKKAAMTQKKKGKAPSNIGHYFATRTTVGSQPTIKSALAGKQAVRKAHMIAAKFFYDACIPLNAVNSIYFQPMFDAAIAIGAGYKVPTYHQFRVPLLQDLKKELELFIATLRTTWADTGCTIMGDGWSDRRHRTLINFLVYCPRGITFVKSVDASDAVKDAQLLFKLFQEIIEWVGVSNVVHMVTDNGANYVAAGRLINETCMTINWSPCAAHCLNLILGEISKMTHIHDLAIRASKVTRYVYNRLWLVAWLRKRKGWAKIVRPGATHFATTFIALHSTHKHMHDLKALVTSKDFVDSRYAKEKKAKEIIAIILDNKFWNDCLIIDKIVEPLMRLLRIVDGDVKPSMGYVYEGIYRARIGIKKVFLNKRRLYKLYTDILKQRWDNQLRKNIHAAAYWLNPAFQYDQVSFCRKPEVMSSFLDLVDTKATCSKTKLLDESRLYRDRLESFGRELALTTCKTTQPEKEDPPLLDYDELEQMLNEDGSTPQSKRQCNRPQDDGDDDAILEIGDDIDLECFGNTNIIDEPNAQDGRDDSENNEDENEDDWLTRGLSRN